MLNFSVHAGFEQYGNMMICLSCNRYSFIINLLKFLSMFFQVASSWSYLQLQSLDLRWMD